MQKYKLKILIIVAGIILGILSSLADKLPVATPLFFIGGFLNTASVWSLTAFTVGTRFKSRANAITFSVLILSLSVTAYYLSGLILGGSESVPLITIAFTFLSWILIAIFIGSLCGLAGMTAKYSKDIKKRMVAVSIPIVIVATESIISSIQLLPYLSSENNNYIPFGILTTLTLVALSVPFFIYNNKRIALYNMVLGLLLSVVGALILMALSTV